ncbi:adenylate/guanylate cyclase domain-containing protein [soil metagenome]
MKDPKRFPVPSASGEGSDGWQALAAYVPRYVVAAAAENGPSVLIGEPHYLTGAVLFADVAGFTPMGEVLARYGSRGTEDLTRLLNHYFATTVELIRSFGGEVVKFAGDGLTALFPGDLAGENAGRSVACAVEMQGTMPRFRAMATVAGEFSLEIKVGVAAGRVMWMIVGDPTVRLEHILAGPPVDLAAEAEHHASKGQVVVHDRLLDLAPGLTAVRVNDQFALVNETHGTFGRKPLGPVASLPDEALRFVSAFLHPLIAGRLTSGRTAFINEHREVTTAFVAFSGGDNDPASSTERGLQALMAKVIQLANRLGGHLAQIDMGDKGSKLILFFGAPVLHEDDPERAVRCVVQLLEENASMRVGMTTGRVFSGEVGSQHRREYLVMGDSVNLAARLMQKAEPGGVLVAAGVRQRVHAFAWSARPPLAVKGKADPVEVWSLSAGAAVVGEPRGLTHDTPVVGRRRELRRALSCLEGAAASSGNVVAITGEPGVGKSRLTAEVARIAGLRGFLTCRGDCRSYGAALTYLPWRSVFRAVLDLDTEAPPEHQQSQVTTYLASVGDEMAERAPLLNPVLNMAMADTSTTSSLDPELRSASLSQLLLSCIRHAARYRPLLLVLEDCHWIDPASRSLLSFLARNIMDTRIAILLTWRTARVEDAVERVLSLPHSQEIALHDLAKKEARKLLDLKLRDLYGSELRPVAPFVRSVLDQARGNPLYIEELAEFARQQGLDPREPNVPAATAFPGSLENLIMARIDSLPDGERTTLKVASVIGGVFRPAWIAGSYPEAGPLAEVGDRLRSLSEKDLIAPRRQEPELEYSFKHALTQDVAYKSITFADRELLHERIAQHIESSYPSPEPFIDELAHHYGHSANAGKQRLYLKRAGDKARFSFANETAVDHYERLLGLLSETEKADTMLNLGEVRQLMGQWKESGRSYGETLRLSQELSDERGVARAEAALGYLLTFTESLDEAVSRLRKAKQSFVDLGDLQGLSQTLEYLGHASFFLGNYRECVSYSEELLSLGEAMGDRALMSAASGNLGRAHWRLGDLPTALAELTRALELAGEIGFQKGVIHASSDIAGLYAQLGDFPRAIAHLGKALQAARKVGYQLVVSVSVGNAGIIYRDVGDFRRASACYERSLAMALELGHWAGVCNIMMELGILFRRMGRDPEAEAALMRSVEISQLLSLRDFESASLFHYAEHLLGTKGAGAAMAPVRKALQLAEEAGDREIMVAAEILEQRIAVATGDTSAAEGTARLKALLEEPLDAAERAEVHYTLWRLDETNARSREEAARLYRDLHEKGPRIKLRERYEELTGEELPASPRLPDLRGMKGDPPPPLPTLLNRVDELTKSLSNEQVA